MTRRRRPAAFRVLLRASVLTAVLCALVPASAHAQVLAAPFDTSYSAADIGSPPGVPDNLGGLTIKAGTTDRLLIGGAANGASGALYEIGVTRDAGGHINGFDGTATRFADAAYNDGGVTYGPGGVLFLARWPVNTLGQTKPGSAVTDKIIDVAPLGVAGALSSVQFVPTGLPGAGSLKLATYSGGEWYDAEVVPDGGGTYDLQNLTAVPGSTLPGGPEGFVYVRAGSPQFTNHSLIVSEFANGQIGAYEIGPAGDPVPASRRPFITGLNGAEGAAIDPLTGDFLFSTFGGGSKVVVVRGFVAPPAPSLPAVVRTSTTWMLRNSLSTGGSDNTFAYGARPLAPLMGDWDGDGTKTAGSYEGGVFKLRNTNAAGVADVTFTFGDPRGFPVGGDFNGDDTDDVAVYRNGTWQVRYSTGTTLTAFSFGTGSWPATVPVVGDWNGDGTDGIGIYTYSSASWSLRNTASAGAPDIGPFVFGTAGSSYPVAGDWDASGNDTVGVKRSVTWQLRNTNDAGAADTSFDFGLASDLPIVWQTP